VLDRRSFARQSHETLSQCVWRVNRVGRLDEAADQLLLLTDGAWAAARIQYRIASVCKAMTAFYNRPKCRNVF
jgi:16S rRNA U516 pseudouridylate synthase RsuA-like enzyme